MVDATAKALPGGKYAVTLKVHAGKVYVDAANTAANKRSGYAVINLSAGYAWARTELTAYVNNAADKHHDVIGFPASTITIYSPLLGGTFRANLFRAGDDGSSWVLTTVQPSKKRQED